MGKALRFELPEVLLERRRGAVRLSTYGLGGPLPLGVFTDLLNIPAGVGFGGLRQAGQLIGIQMFCVPGKDRLAGRAGGQVKLDGYVKPRK